MCRSMNNKPTTPPPKSAKVCNHNRTETSETTPHLTLTPVGSLSYAWCHSPADYRRLASWCCPTCATPVPPATPTREPESSDLERTRSTLSSGDSLSHQSLYIGPSSPSAQTSTAVPGPALERGRFLQVLVTCVQETKLGVNSSLKEFTDYATVRRDRPTGSGGGGLVTLVHHSAPCRVPDRGILPDDGTAKVLAVETNFGGTTLTFVNIILSGSSALGTTPPTSHGSPSPPLGLTISLTSHAPPSLRKARSFTNLHKADWEGYTAELKRKFTDTPLPTGNSCNRRGKSLQADPRRCRKTPHPLWLCQGLQRPSPRSCATPHLGERPAPH